MSQSCPGPVTPILDRIHHISFVVSNLEEAIGQFEKLLGVPIAERGPITERLGEVAIFKLANVRLELVAPVAPSSPLHDYLELHGEGFFHLAFAVQDVAVAHAQLESRGVLMKEPPRPAYKDWTIAYINSEQTRGINMHLINEGAA